MNEIINFVWNVTLQTSKMFKENVTSEQIRNFKRYLEDSILADVINCNEKMLKVDSKTLPQSIQSALIASGISPKGKIPKGEHYEYKPLSFTIDAHRYAKERVKELEENRLGYSYQYGVCQLVDSFKKNREEYLNMYQLIELMIAQKERNCGYIEGNSMENSFYDGAIIMLSMIQKELLQKHNLQDTLAYQILIDLDTKEGHTSLATTKALAGMAQIDLITEIEGISSFNDEESLEEVLQNIEAAKVESPDLLKDYEEKFKIKMKPCIRAMHSKKKTNPEKIKSKRYPKK